MYDPLHYAADRTDLLDGPFPCYSDTHTPGAGVQSGQRPTLGKLETTSLIASYDNKNSWDGALP